MTGASTPNNLAILRSLLASEKPARTLEIGLGPGASAEVLCASGDHTAIDPWHRTAYNGCALHLPLRYIEKRSEIALPSMLEAGERFGLIYIDGSHLFESVFIDAYYCMRLLAEGGVMLFDDSAKTDVGNALRIVRALPGLAEIDLSAHHPKPLRYRAAKLLGRNQMTGFRRVGEVIRAWNSAPLHF